MSRAREGQLFIGRLNRNTRVRDLEEVFETYGRLTRCDIKYGGMYPVTGFVFINFTKVWRISCLRNALYSNFDF